MMNMNKGKKLRKSKALTFVSAILISKKRKR